MNKLDNWPCVCAVVTKAGRVRWRSRQ